jgi:predicted ATPase/DNA-binding XRE family transcriptional regulator
MKTSAHDPSPFGTELQRLRRAAGLSQQELAERAGLSLRGIADLERGARRAPYPATVRRLVQALELNEVDRAALLTGTATSDLITGSIQVEPTRLLPLQLSSFVGREREKGAVQRLLETERLVTLTGTGGIGKTRLALEVAASGAEVIFVDLAIVSEGELVAPAVAAAFGIRKQPDVPLHALLSRWLAARNLLLVLDNCEHLLQACSQLTEILLRACPGLRILATSRERLGVPGEVSWRVPSLVVPDSDTSLERLPTCETVRLFLERATTVSGAFSLTPQNAASVATLCRRLDGIPLAIELAAARVNVLSVEQIANRLDDAVRLLVGGGRTAPARHQTLQATFEWSYGLLSEPERLLFARVSVFSGGWTLVAAEEICAEDAREQLMPPTHLERGCVLDVLSQLIDKSLVLAEPADHELRYRLLEPVRQFAAQRLLQQGGVAALRERHARWFAELVADSAGEYHSPNEIAALERLDREHANIQATFDWMLEEHARTDGAVRLAKGLWWFWAARDHWTEADSRLRRLLDSLAVHACRSRDLDLLWMTGSIAWIRGDLSAANQWIGECLVAARQRNQPRVLGHVLSIAAQLAAARGEYATARQLFDDGLPLARAAGERWSEARYLDGLAMLAIEQGDFDEAAGLLRSSLGVAQAMGDAWSVAAALNKLGDVARSQGDSARARSLYEKSLVQLEGLGTELRASVLHNLGYVAIAEADQPRSAALFAQSLKVSQARGDQRGVAECLVGFACLTAASGQRARAARLFGAADAALQSLGTDLSPSNRTDQARGLDLARTGNEAAFASAYAAGQELTLDEGVREALNTGASCEPLR